MNPIQSFFSTLFLNLSPKNTPTQNKSDSNSMTVYERIFKQYDEDGDGKLSALELRKCIGFDNISAEDAAVLFQFTDSDGDGKIELEEFVKLVEVEDEEEKEKDLREAFEVYEMEGEECITPKSLKSALERLGQMKSEQECKSMIERFDINGDGVISFDEFEVMMM